MENDQVICGPMFAGKTAEVVLRVNAMTAAGLRVRVYSHAWDDRYSTTYLISREGQWVKSSRVAELSEELLRDVDVVVVDEGQFFTGVVDFCHLARKQKVRVLVAGLDYNADGEPFGEMLDVCALKGFEVTQLRAWCKVCGEEAPYTKRLVAGVTVGGVDEYEPRCAHHFTVKSQEIVEQQEPPAPTGLGLMTLQQA
jgi:thymidine kinase